MTEFIFYNEAKCVIETLKDDQSCSSSIKSEDNLLFEFATSFGINNFLDNDYDASKIEFDSESQLTIHTSIDGTGIIGNQKHWCYNL